ncbi:MAG: adenosylcobinamide-GDP ribazoletransferase [Porticoccaceae bacterium]
MAGPREECRALAIALGLLTRIPVRVRGDISAATLGRSLHWYPAAGLAIGLLLMLLAALLPDVGLLAAAVIVAAWVAITGALHLDGLADCADAWVGGMGDRERTLAIMKDPACGPMGVTAIALALLLKVAALAALLAGPAAVAWWLVPLAARTLLPLAFIGLPYVRQGGMGDGLAANASKPGLALAAGLVLGILVLGLPVQLAALWLAVALAAFALWRHGVRRRLGGFTGDCAGALVELVEVALLVASAFFISGFAQ